MFVSLNYDFVATFLDCAFNPFWKIWSSIWIISPSMGKNQKNKTNTSFRNFYGFMFGSSMDQQIHPCPPLPAAVAQESGLGGWKRHKGFVVDTLPTMGFEERIRGSCRFLQANGPIFFWTMTGGLSKKDTAHPDIAHTRQSPSQLWRESLCSPLVKA